MRAAILGLAAMLCACGEAPAPDSEVIAQAAALSPANGRLAQLYQQSCRACHAQLGAGAPLTGDRRAWDRRWRKGMDTLMQNTLAGMGAMPAGGQCFSCTQEDYERLIRFMAGRGET